MSAPAGGREGLLFLRDREPEAHSALTGPVERGLERLSGSDGGDTIRHWLAETRVNRGCSCVCPQSYTPFSAHLCRSGAVLGFGAPRGCLQGNVADHAGPQGSAGQCVPATERRGLGTGSPSSRTFLRGDRAWSGVGLADGGLGLLTVPFETVSDTWQTVMSVTVTVPGDSDLVVIGVGGRYSGFSLAGLYVVDGAGNELWLVPDPSPPGAATNLGRFPAGLDSPQGRGLHRG